MEINNDGEISTNWRNLFLTTASKEHKVFFHQYALRGKGS